MDHMPDNTMSQERRKRINRYKKTIMVIIILSVLIPLVLCVILLLRVNKLENQIDYLISLKDSGQLVAEKNSSDKDDPLDIKFVYAEEISDDNSTEVKANIQEPESETETTQSSADTSSLQPDVSQQQMPPDDSLVTQPILPNVQEEEQSVKKVYLTFDDGPSIYTNQILDILEKYGVKATFFVNGREDNDSLAAYRRIAADGHTLGLHTYSHLYSYVYASVDNFKLDVERLRTLLYNTTGQDITLLRFPGGSSNTVSEISMNEFIKFANDNGYTYFDWNVSSGDASSQKISSQEIIDNIMNGVVNFNNSVVLMHDAKDKDTTVEALPALIESLQSNGYQILPIDSNVTPVQHIKAESIN